MARDETGHAGRAWSSALLAVATVVGQVVQRQPHLGLNAAAIATFNRRVRAWWIICALLAVAFFSPALTVALFGFMCFWALREFITLTPTRLGDHRALFWVFFFFTPLQYVLVGVQQLRAVQHPDPRVRVPVHPGPHRARRRLQAVSGARRQDSVRPVDLRLLPELRAGAAVPRHSRHRGDDTRQPRRLLFFFVTMALLSDAFQFVWSQLYGRHVIAPSINAARTWEGLVGGSASTALVGHGAVLGHAVQRRLAGGLHVAGHRRDGLRRRDDDVGHQARPRRARLRHARRRPRRRARPHRRDLLRRAGVLPRHAAAVRHR